MTMDKLSCSTSPLPESRLPVSVSHKEPLSLSSNAETPHENEASVSSVVSLSNVDKVAVSSSVSPTLLPLSNSKSQPLPNSEETLSVDESGFSSQIPLTNVDKPAALSSVSPDSKPLPLPNDKQTIHVIEDEPGALSYFPLTSVATSNQASSNSKPASHLSASQSLLNKESPLTPSNTCISSAGKVHVPSCVSILPPPPPPPPPSLAKHQERKINIKSPASSLPTKPGADSQDPSQMQPSEIDEKLKEQFDKRLKKIVDEEIGQDQCYIALTSRKDVQPIIQKGPCCGIVALAMAGQMLSSKPVDVSEVLSLSRQRGFSVQGEMFSAANMKSLADEVYSCISSLIDMSSPSATPTLMNFLARGQPVLVPYDADRNHSPCLKRGHKAHWALITGFLLFVDKKICDDLTSFKEDLEIPKLHHLSPGNSLADVLGLLQNSKSIYVYGLQGKSRHIGIWTLESLLSSNGNLVEVEPKRSADEAMYVLPASGIHQELCNKIVAINGAEMMGLGYIQNVLDWLWSSCTFL